MNYPWCEKHGVFFSETCCFCDDENEEKIAPERIADAFAAQWGRA